MTASPPLASVRVDLQQLDATIQSTCEAVFSRIEGSGRFLAPGDSGLTSTLYVITTLHFLGRLELIDARGAARTVRDSQLPNGAFPNYPSDPHGDPWVSALAAGALRVTAPDESAEALRRAEAYLEAQGGAAVIADGIYRLNVNPLFLSMAGQLDPTSLPHIPAEPLLLHPVMERARRQANVACLWMGVAIWAIVRHLQDPTRRTSPSWLESHERARALEILSQFQNPLGSFNATVLQTALAAAAFHCLGVADDDPRLEKAVTWLWHTGFDDDRAPGGAARSLGTAASFHGFQTAIWTTALAVRALLAAGVSRAHPKIASAIHWLVDAQVAVDLPPLVPMPDGAPRQGGWAFEINNVTVPDSDDSAVAIAALGLTLQGDGEDQMDAGTRERARASAAKGLAYLLAMQNPDGGWPAFQQGLPGKPRGPILVSYPHFERGHLLQELRTAAQSALIFGDPATEDITGRALFALAQHGYTHDSPVVRRAIDFLIAQQCTQEDLGGGSEHEGGGPWWSRWIANYLTATSYVLGGLVAVGVDPAQPFIRRAIDWVLRRQNADGGWGESAESYKDPSRAGIAPSMPVATAIVLCGLIQAGEGRSEAVARGIAYLLACPRDAQGMWADLGPLHVFYRTDTFYAFIGARYYYPLEALGRYRALLSGQAPRVALGGVTASSLARAESAGHAPLAAAPRAPDGGWSPQGLVAMRRLGDPEADEVVRAIFRAGDVGAVNALMMTIVHNDDPVPRDLPAPAVAYFERTAELPAWADPHQLAHASAMFGRVGWATGVALFNAALPQCYASANGAKVLLGTRGLVDVAERRVLETAQFIFDVTGREGFAPRGLAIRAAQKVRLLHAAIRHLTLAKATWSLEWGVPINQQDEAGTLMSFSYVIAEAWKKMGLTFSEADDEAWLHLWKVVGHVMGVHPALQPRDMSDAGALWQAIIGSQWARSDEGTALCQALLAVSERYLPHFEGAQLPATLIRHFSGDACADLLGVPKGDWTEALLRAASRAEARAGILISLFPLSGRPAPKVPPQRKPLSLGA